MVSYFIFAAALLLTESSKQAPNQSRFSSHPAADFSENAPFLPRVVLYQSYKFPLRDDGSLIAFSEKEKQRGHHVVSDKQLAKVLFPGEEFEEVKEKVNFNANLMDTPFWRDAPLHHMHNVETDLDGATATWMTEPAFTKTEYIGESDDGLRQLYLGNAIRQIYEPFGFPFEVPCYTKYVENFNSTTIFYKIPNRNFLSLPESSMFDPVGKEEIPTYLSYAVSKMAKLNHSKPLEIAAWPQLLGRNTGAFTHTEVKSFLNKADGSLTINPFLEGFAQSSRAAIEPWGSFVCAAMVDNEPRHLGVVTNLDYIGIDKHPLKYSDFKVYDEEQKKPPGKKEPLPILDSATNLKIDISWDDWSCCSACCCTSMLCGKFYTPDRKCNRLHSVKVRKGYLSLMKINPEEPIRPWDRNDVNVEFQTMMSISPYKERGIALFSTIWDSSDYLREAQKYKERLYRDRFKGLSNITNGVGDHPGIYIDEAPCTQEKYDYVKLARCRGIDITSKIDEELEVEVDPCAEYESQIEIIFIEEEHTEVPLFAGKNYRVRLREEVFSTDATQARWKVSSRPPAHYDRSKMCLEQGIVLQKNGDLLMTRLTSKDVRRHVEVTLSDGRKISIQFTNAGLKLGLGDDRDVLIMWAVILTACENNRRIHNATRILIVLSAATCGKYYSEKTLGCILASEEEPLTLIRLIVSWSSYWPYLCESVFFVLLALFVAIMHNRRRARMQQILLNRMRKRLRAEGKLQ